MRDWVNRRFDLCGFCDFCGFRVGLIPDKKLREILCILSIVSYLLYISIFMDYLSKMNPHIRDSGISLDDSTHIYNIKGDFSYTSVTRWNHSHFEPFNSDSIIRNMMRSKNWPNSKYYEMTAEEIKAGWDANRDAAAGAGTKMHYDIECFYNNCPNTNSSIEYSYFENFVNDFDNLKAYRTEWIVYHEELKMAGSIDMLFENPDGTLAIYDWKRSKEIVKNNRFGKWSTSECISHLPDTNFWHYSLQLNVYKAIIEEKYGKGVTDLYLVCLHPDNANGNYQRIKVPDLGKEIGELFEMRRAEMSN